MGRCFCHPLRNCCRRLEAYRPGALVNPRSASELRTDGRHGDPGLPSLSSPQDVEVMSSIPLRHFQPPARPQGRCSKLWHIRSHQGRETLVVDAVVRIFQRTDPSIFGVVFWHREGTAVLRAVPNMHSLRAVAPLLQSSPDCLVNQVGVRTVNMYKGPTRLWPCVRAFHQKIRILNQCRQTRIEFLQCIRSVAGRCNLRHTSAGPQSFGGLPCPITIKVEL